MRELARVETNFSFRPNLLATASVFAILVASIGSPASATDQMSGPTFWIELGGQLARIDGGQEIDAPLFSQQFKADNFLPMIAVQRAARYGEGFEGAISIDPANSEWMFSASARYGRSNKASSSHNQDDTPQQFHRTIRVPALGIDAVQTLPSQPLGRFADSSSHNSESDLVLDFRAGKDVGLGLLKGSSKFSLGIRVAQLNSNSSISVTANSGNRHSYKYATQLAGYSAFIKAPTLPVSDLYHGHAVISRSFTGGGPSLSFDASIPLSREADSLGMNLDLGVTGALLVGRQKVAVAHSTREDESIPTTANYVPLTNIYHHTFDRARSRIVVVPDVGAVAGVSFNYSNATLKFGYRADFFFGATDGGVDARKSYDRGFYGPFAAVRIGFGG